MPTFQKVKLGDIATVIMGQSPASEFYNQGGNGLPFFQGVKDFGEKYPTEASWSTVTPRVAEKGDVLFSVRAPVGELNIANKKCCIGRGVAAIRSINNQSDYLYFLLKSHIEKIKSFGNGSVYDAVNKDTLEKIIVDVFPDPKTQTRIASVLSAYDDLIENNEKRIKALEEIAQLLYTEWFVKFKFPPRLAVARSSKQQRRCGDAKAGEHEKMKMKSRSERSSATGMIDSGTEYGMIPEGWEVKGLGAIVENIHNSTCAGMHLSDRQYVPIENIPRKSFILREASDWEDAQSSLVLFEEKDILFGAMRPYFHKVAIAMRPGVTRTTCLVLRPKKSNLHAFALLTIFSDKFISFASSSTQGATIPYSVWTNSIENFAILIPDSRILKIFEELIDGIIDQMQGIAEINKSLSQTRDLLIPQLVTGKRELKS